MYLAHDNETADRDFPSEAASQASSIWAPASLGERFEGPLESGRRLAVDDYPRLRRKRPKLGTNVVVSPRSHFCHNSLTVPI